MQAHSRRISPKRRWKDRCGRRWRSWWNEQPVWQWRSGLCPILESPSSLMVIVQEVKEEAWATVRSTRHMYQRVICHIVAVALLPMILSWCFLFCFSITSCYCYHCSYLCPTGHLQKSIAIRPVGLEALPMHQGLFYFYDQKVLPDPS